MRKEREVSICRLKGRNDAITVAKENPSEQFKGPIPYDIPLTIRQYIVCMAVQNAEKWLYRCGCVRLITVQSGHLLLVSIEFNPTIKIKISFYSFPLQTRLKHSDSGELQLFG